MNKILLICGSIREAFSYKILKEIQSNLDNSNLIKLKDYNIEYCRGCLSCDKEGKCIINDDLNKIVKEIDDCDTIVFTIPNYFGGMSGFFKNFIDRLHFMYKRSILKTKNVVFIYVSATENEEVTMDQMMNATANIEKYLEIPVIQRYSFSSRKELDINKINDIILFLNK